MWITPLPIKNNISFDQYVAHIKNFVPQENVDEAIIAGVEPLRLFGKNQVKLPPSDWAWAPGTIVSLILINLSIYTPKPIKE